MFPFCVTNLTAANSIILLFTKSRPEVSVSTAIMESYLYDDIARDYLFYTNYYWNVIENISLIPLRNFSVPIISSLNFPV